MESASIQEYDDQAYQDIYYIADSFQDMMEKFRLVKVAWFLIKTLLFVDFNPLRIVFLWYFEVIVSLPGFRIIDYYYIFLFTFLQIFNLKQNHFSQSSGMSIAPWSDQ